MSRIARTLPVSGKVYRHFAVITLVVTAAIAMFADGERREEIADAVVARKAMANAEARRLNGGVDNAVGRKLVLRQQIAATSWGPEEVVSIDNAIDFSPSARRAAAVARRLPPVLPKGKRQVSIPAGPYPGFRPGGDNGQLVPVPNRIAGHVLGPQDVTEEQRRLLDEGSRERSGAPLDD